jgi:hypothetical protein
VVVPNILTAQKGDADGVVDIEGVAEGVVDLVGDAVTVGDGVREGV